MLYRRERAADGAWVPAEARFQGSGRTLMLIPFNLETWAKYADFRPACAHGRPRPGGPAASLNRATAMTRIRTALLVAAVALFAVVPSVATFYTDWLWFGEVGYQSVFATRLATQAGLFVSALLAVVHRSRGESRAGAGQRAAARVLRDDAGRAAHHHRRSRCGCGRWSSRSRWASACWPASTRRPTPTSGCSSGTRRRSARWTRSSATMSGSTCSGCRSSSSRSPSGCCWPGSRSSAPRSSTRCPTASAWTRAAACSSASARSGTWPCSGRPCS